MEFYLDGEFDAVYHHGTYVQCLISIGIVAYKDGKLQGSYYSLIRPKHFYRLTRVVKKITHLKTEEIRKARSFETVIREANEFIAAIDDQECSLYSFGPDDARTLRNHAAYETVVLPEPFMDIVDLQRVLSREIVWEGKIISPTLSLDDLKFVYGMEGAVVHNALNDAVDLMRIHEAARRKRQLPDRIKSLWDQKEQHRQAVKQRNYENMLKVLHERYGKYAGQQRSMIFYPDVIRHLSAMKDLGEELKISETGLYDENNFYPYEAVQGKMSWEQKEILQVNLQFHLGDRSFKVICPLTYRNGAHFYSIWQLIDPKETDQAESGVSIAKEETACADTKQPSSERKKA